MGHSVLSGVGHGGLR